MPDTLAQKIKAKYPGVYDDLSDADLESKIDAKYPGVYADVPHTAAASKPQNLGEMLANVPTDEAGNPLGQPSGLRQSLEMAAFPQSASDIAALAVPSGADVAQAIRGGVRAAPTLIGAGLGYLHSGPYGAIIGATGGGIAGAVGRLALAAMEGARDAIHPVQAVRQALQETGLTMDGKFLPQAINRIAKGESAADVVKEFAGKSRATTAEVGAAMGVEKKPAEIIPFSPALKASLPEFPPTPTPNVAPPIQAIPPPAEGLSPTRQAFATVRAAARSQGLTPPTWEEFQRAQTVTQPGQLLPPQPERFTSEGNPQYTRPGPPLAKPPKTAEAFRAARDAARAKGEIPPTWPQFLAGAY